jgi:hypothetical protein
MSLLKLANMSRNSFEDEDERIFKIKMFSEDELKPILKKIAERPMHSINDINFFYEQITKNSNYKNNAIKKSKIEKKMEKIFGNGNFNKEKIEQIFPLARLNFQMKSLNDEIKNLFNAKDKLKKKQLELERVENERMELKKPITHFVKFFIDLIMEDNFFSQLVLFESFLIEFKRETLKQLRNTLKEKQEKLISVSNLISKESSEDQIENYQIQQETLRYDVEHLKYQIEVMDLTVDKFWDELFSIYDWISEKESSFHVFNMPLKGEVDNFNKQIHALLDKYILLIEYGYSIHLLRGKPLKLESKALKQVFDKLKNNTKILIITVIGEQSSAKSSLMNTLFGCDFRTSAGRCTVGIYMNFVKFNDKTIVILDSEGLVSIESHDNVLDNQLATMAVLSSHLIIVNHKGEISTNLERLLGITFYAKLHTHSSTFKPSILFVLRDQTNRDSSAVKTQAAELKVKLMNQAGKLNKSIDEIMLIDTDNIVLLPNAFAEDNEVKWRNNMFPVEILGLRKKFLNILDEMNINGHRFNKLSDLYSSMSSFWKLMQDLGDGILNCKDLEEIKIRNEIITKSLQVQDKHSKFFQKICTDKITETKEKIFRNGQFENKIKDQIKTFLDDRFKEQCEQVKSQFNSEIRIFNYPECLISESESNVKENLDRIKKILFDDWNNYCTEKLETHLFNNAQQSYVKKVSDLILSDTSSYRNEMELESEIQKMVNEFEKTNTKSIESFYPRDEHYIEEIQNLYNTNHKTYIFDLELKMFESFPYFDSLKGDFEIYANFQNNPKELISNFINIHKVDDPHILSKIINSMTKLFGKKLNEKDSITMFKNKLENFIYSAVNKVEYDATFSINSCQVEDMHIRNSLYIIKSILLKKDSPLLGHEGYFDQRELLKNIVKLTFYSIYKKYIDNKNKEIEKSKTNFQEQKKKLLQEARDAFESFGNSNKCGQDTSKKLYDTMFSLLLEKSKEKTKTQITAKIIELLKNTDELLDNAFKRSFQASDYQAVYKYVTNIVDYCVEVSESTTKESIRNIINISCENFKKMVNDFYKFINNFFRIITNFKDVYEYIEAIVKYSKEKTEYCEFTGLLTSAKNVIINVKIKDPDHFAASFKKEFTQKQTNLDNESRKHIRELEEYSRKNSEWNIKTFIGCSSVCPGCGSKCNGRIGHPGQHKVNKHILNGFHNWRVEGTHIVVTDYCWDSAFYLNKVIVDDKTYSSFKV